MKVFIIFILPFLISSFKKIAFEMEKFFFPEEAFFIEANEREYDIIISDSINSWNRYSRLFRIDSETDEIISQNAIFADYIISMHNFGNKVKAYEFSSYIFIERNLKNNTIGFIRYLLHTVYGENSILTSIRTDTKYLFLHNIELYLINDPYISISKNVTIEENINYQDFYLIPLKKCFLFIICRNEENALSYCLKGEYEIKILNLNLDLINSVNVTFYNYTKVHFLKLSESKILNEFLICIKYYDSHLTCQIIEYQNSNLVFGEIYQIFKRKYTSNYDYLIDIFDGNKIGYYSSDSSDYITIMQYNDKKLYYYKDIDEIRINIPKSGCYFKSSSRLAMTHKGIAMITPSTQSFHLYFFSSICSSCNISLYPNQLSEFPIENIITQGIDQIKFSFEEIPSILKIYKNSTEFGTGEAFYDLNNFTYYLEIDDYMVNDYIIKIRNIQYNYACKIKIDVIIETYINTYKEFERKLHKCLFNKKRKYINNITDSNLYQSFSVEQNPQFFTLNF